MNYAIVDLGSNTIRLSVYHILPRGDYELLFSKKEMAGLVNYISDGVLSPAGIRKACEVLWNFRNLLRHFGIGNLHVFATASLRNIRNSREAMAAIREETGIGVEVLSGDEEAELGYYGALRTLDLRDGALFDIGGGSTEIVEVQEGKILRAQSLPLGSLNLFTRYVEKIWPRKREARAIEEEVQNALTEANLPTAADGLVCGIGGTARAVLKIVNHTFSRPADNRHMTAAELRKMTGMLMKRDHQARQIILKVCPDRIHTILPGLLLMNRLCKELNGKELYVSQYGVREGYLCHKLLSTGI